MEIYTIGHSGKTAEEFFGALRTAGISRVIDIRLNNKSQLLGFTKGDDLRFFLREICGSTYEHEPILAPTAEILTAYRKKALDWGGYEEQFLRLITERRIQDRLEQEAFHLVITDPIWKAWLLKSYELGVYDAESFQGKYVLTVSLGEPLDGWCYKLVAAVMKLRARPKA